MVRSDDHRFQSRRGLLSQTWSVGTPPIPACLRSPLHDPLNGQGPGRRIDADPEGGLRPRRQADVDGLYRRRGCRCGVERAEEQRRHGEASARGYPGCRPFCGRSRSGWRHLQSLHDQGRRNAEDLHQWRPARSAGASSMPPMARRPIDFYSQMFGWTKTEAMDMGAARRLPALRLRRQRRGRRHHDQDDGDADADVALLLRRRCNSMRPSSA